MTHLLLTINTLLTLLTLLVVVRTLRTPDATADITPDVPDNTDKHTDFVDSEILTEYELRKLEEEAEFDLRIARIKNELAMQVPDVPRKGTDAPVFHPNVQNLPHHIITDYDNGLPDVEYTR